MSIFIRSHRGVPANNSTSQSVTTKEVDTTSSAQGVKFDFEKLNEKFLKEGLNSLISNLRELQKSGVIGAITVHTDRSTQKTTVSIEVDGIGYEFTGIQGETSTGTPDTPTTPDTSTKDTPTTPTEPANPPVSSEPTTPEPPITVTKPTETVNPAEALRVPIADVADYIVSVCKDAMTSRDSFLVNYSLTTKGNMQFQDGSDAEKVFYTIYAKLKSTLSRHAAEAFDKMGGDDFLMKLLQAAWIDASAGINTGSKANTSDFINKVMLYIDNILEKSVKDDKYLEYYVNNCYQDQTLIECLPNIIDTSIKTGNVLKYGDGKTHLDDDVSDEKFQATMSQLLERLCNKYPEIDKDYLKQLFYQAQENALSFKDRPNGINTRTSNMAEIVRLVLYHFDKLFKQGARITVFEERKADAPIAEPKSSQTEEQNKNIKEGASGIMNDVLDVKDFIASNCKNKIDKTTIHTEFGIDANGDIVFQEKDTKVVFDEIFDTLERRIKRKSADALEKLGGSEVLKQLLQAAWITTYNSFNSSESNDIRDFVNKVMDNMEQILTKLQTNPELMEVFTKHTSYADETLTKELTHYNTRTTYGNDEKINYSGTPTVHDDGSVHISVTVDDNDYQATMSMMLNRLINKYPSVSRDVITSVFRDAQQKALQTLQKDFNDCPYGTTRDDSRVEDTERNWGEGDNRKGDRCYIDMDQLVQITLYYFDKLLYAELLK